MNKYETMCVFAPDLAGENLKTLEDKIKKIFNNHNIKEITKKDWGNRKLAYTINSYKTGNYAMYSYEADVKLINELEKNLGYEESVLRFLTTKITKRTPENVQLEPAGFELPEYL